MTQAHVLPRGSDSMPFIHHNSNPCRYENIHHIFPKASYVDLVERNMRTPRVHNAYYTHSSMANMILYFNNDIIQRRISIVLSVCVCDVCTAELLYTFYVVAAMNGCLPWWH